MNWSLVCVVITRLPWLEVRQWWSDMCCPRRMSPCWRPMRNADPMLMPRPAVTMLFMCLSLGGAPRYTVHWSLFMDYCGCLMYVYVDLSHKDFSNIQFWYFIWKLYCTFVLFNTCLLKRIFFFKLAIAGHEPATFWLQNCRPITRPNYNSNVYYVSSPMQVWITSLTSSGQPSTQTWHTVNPLLVKMKS